MKTTYDPLDMGKRACDTLMRRYRAPDLPPAGHFHYHQGVFLSGVYETYRLCGNEAYFDYMRAWVDAMLDGEGTPRNALHAVMDDMQPGILLFPLYEKTGEERYKKALDALADAFDDIPRTRENGFWHKPDLPGQMWLDGLYMAGPLMTQYAARFQRPELRDLALEQIRLMFRVARDEQNGLMRHAYDETRAAPWADPQTGRSPECWGRAVGWVTVALANDLDFLAAASPAYQEIAALESDLLRAVMRVQGPDGRWFQVLDKPDAPHNFYENSVSCLFVAALCKAVRLGLLTEDALSAACRGFDGVCASLSEKDGDLLIGQVCVGTGVGDYTHYAHRPTSVNDLHGVGAFLIMCAQMQRLTCFSKYGINMLDNSHYKQL